MIAVAKFVNTNKRVGEGANSSRLAPFVSEGNEDRLMGSRPNLSNLEKRFLR